MAPIKNQCRGPGSQPNKNTRPERVRHVVPTLQHPDSAVHEPHQQNCHQQFAGMHPAVAQGYEVQRQQGKAAGGMPPRPATAITGFVPQGEVFQPACQAQLRAIGQARPDKRQQAADHRQFTGPVRQYPWPLVGKGVSGKVAITLVEPEMSGYVPTQRPPLAPTACTTLRSAPCHKASERFENARAPGICG